MILEIEDPSFQVNPMFIMKITANERGLIDVLLGDGNTVVIAPNQLTVISKQLPWYDAGAGVKHRPKGRVQDN